VGVKSPRLLLRHPHRQSSFRTSQHSFLLIDSGHMVIIHINNVLLRFHFQHAFLPKLDADWMVLLIPSYWLPSPIFRFLENTGKHRPPFSCGTNSSDQTMITELATCAFPAHPTIFSRAGNRVEINHVCNGCSQLVNNVSCDDCVISPTKCPEPAVTWTSGSSATHSPTLQSNILLDNYVIN
jgi:hypothetical protein